MVSSMTAVNPVQATDAVMSAFEGVIRYGIIGLVAVFIVAVAIIVYNEIHSY